MKIFLLILFCAIGGPTMLAQISGEIHDAKSGNPLENVEVFINGSTLFTASDAAGEFSLNAVPEGFVDVVLYKQGYALYRSRMRIVRNKSYQLHLGLEAGKKDRKQKELSGSARQELEAVLMGAGNPDGCVVEDVTDTKSRWKDQPIVMNNPHTGYALRFFPIGPFADSYQQVPFYLDPLTDSNVNQLVDWEENRMARYHGSFSEWLAWMCGRSLATFQMFDAEDNRLEQSEMVKSSSLAGYKRIQLPGTISVMRDLGNGDVRRSTISATSALEVSPSGMLLDENGVTLAGDMSPLAPARQLPVNYVPVQGNVARDYQQALRNFYEHIYVQTDKPYYYPGEGLWYKAYIDYLNPAWRDSLSKVLYVEIINPKKEIVYSQTVKIDSGFAMGDFVLSDSLPSDTYCLRAYTNVMRNFGDDVLFKKPLPVLNLDSKPRILLNEAPESNGVSIKADKDVYLQRQRVDLMVQVSGRNGAMSGGALSVSVTDASQVLDIGSPRNILTDYPIDTAAIKKIEAMPFQLENGLSLEGVFSNNRGTPEKTDLDIVLSNPRRLLQVTTNEKGWFKIGGITSFDSTSVLFKSNKAKTAPYGKVSLLARTPAPITSLPSLSLETVDAGSVQRIVTEYEVPKGAILLNDVEVKASRTGDLNELDYRTKHPYGQPNYTLHARDLNLMQPNLLYSIVGKVPGLMVEPSTGSIGFTRAMTSSISHGGGPLVLLNNVPLSGNAGETIASINPQTVESIEFTPRLNVMYGSQGAFGVISIYTKTGPLEEPVDANFQKVIVSGFHRPHQFNSPNYDTGEVLEGPDYRSLLYWNPKIEVPESGKPAVVSFYTSDLAGKYRVTIEGTDSGGNPVRGVYFLTVNDD